MEATGDSRALVFGLTLGAIGGIVIGSLFAFGIWPVVERAWRRGPFGRQQLRFEVFQQ